MTASTISKRAEKKLQRRARVTQLKADIAEGRYVVDLNLLAGKLIDKLGLALAPRLRRDAPLV